LNNIILLQGDQTSISNRLRLRLGVRIEKIFKLVVLLKFLLGDEIVEFREDDWDILGDVREPGKFTFG
jgi:hypothetical protein